MAVPSAFFFSLLSTPDGFTLVPTSLSQLKRLPGTPSPDSRVCYSFLSPYFAIPLVPLLLVFSSCSWPDSQLTIFYRRTDGKEFTYRYIEFGTRFSSQPLFVGYSSGRHELPPAVQVDSAPSTSRTRPLA
ncbi:hypothetical protein L249_3547 [Ophiocordyceps polyrhachis-furcata BCC 54312]|uniref:Uncharacterized protein n=1 Tax=Ophiocordyceps polyrhachis-furcata BCC 54312 TaxID=1330021 RepID=A0A367LM43_9HYPO|nr:hypothetical protein L249_3547 [Ophiocordyceps polyrhachis-furcata BCC 54312]